MTKSQKRSDFWLS